MIIRYLTAIIICMSLTICLGNAKLWSADEEYPDVPAWPGNSRTALQMPDEIWTRLCGHAGFPDGPIGYTREEMEHFTGHPYRLRVVENLFKDASSTPLFSGNLSSQLRDSKDKPVDIILNCYKLLDAYAGRDFPVPKSDDWGVDWIPKGTSPKSAIDYVLKYNFDNGVNSSPRPIDTERWNKLPEGIQRLVIRMVIAAIKATPQVINAFDEKTLMEIYKTLYSIITAPWDDTETNVTRESFKIIDAIDINYLAYGSIIYLSHVQAALIELQEWLKTSDLANLDFDRMEFDTAIGKVMIDGKGDSEINGSFALVVDLGGNDHYTGITAVPSSLDNPISTVVDLGGSDRYETSEPGGLACGLFGLGMIFDLAGDDSYSCESSGIGCAWGGTGFVMDYTGNDKYYTKDRWGEGAAHSGIGALIDLGGDDHYFYGSESQGLGATLGVGLLLDSSGNDKYLLSEEIKAVKTEDGEPPASLAQGCGFGRRADFSDGHSLAGGIGIMIEGGGNDYYEGLGRFVQGTGYWWGIGILEDYSGNDTYKGYWYAQGASAHFAIGCMVDIEGDDIYNDDYAVSQVLGNGRDGSIAWFIDGDGDDTYRIPNRSAGEGDLNGIGIFWDRRGDDVYKTQFKERFGTTPILGAATTEGMPYKTFRDTMMSVGVFLDTGGADTYDATGYVDAVDKTRKLQAANDTDWWHNMGPVLWGYGFDLDWYPPAANKKI